MSWRPLATGLAISLALTACSGAGEGNEAANGSAPGEPANASEAAGGQTIAAGLDQNSRFFQAARAAGLDATLAGPGPYTVLVPADQAFGKLPAGTMEGLMRPESRAELTRVLTYHILPGVVLTQDIAKAIENAKGKAVLATMGGETLTATREGDRIILTDAGGNRAALVQPDQQRSNGVVHHIDAVLVPAPNAAAQG